MSTRDVFAVVGTVVGAYFGNPQLGYAIGSAIGGAVDPQIIKGPSLGDLAKQTSLEGVPRPIIWALSPPMGGNVIACSEPKIVRKRKRQGKGGPKVETEHVYRTYAVGVCEGPITRFVRVWRNNVLVYDVSEFPQLTDEENAEFLTHARFHLGGWDQQPAPELERVFGVGTTPSHRGTAYMVMDDEELTDLRGAIPQWMFQVERCEGFYLTSRLYSLEVIDAMVSSGDAIDVHMPSFIESLDISMSLIGADLREPVHTYSETEALDVDVGLIGGDLRDVLIVYAPDPESLEVSADLIAGDLRDALITYTDDDEALNVTFGLVGGDLT